MNDRVSASEALRRVHDRVTEAILVDAIVWWRVTLRYNALLWVNVELVGERAVREALAGPMAAHQWTSVAEAHGLEPSTTLPLAYHLSPAGWMSFESWSGTHPMVPVLGRAQDAGAPRHTASAWVGEGEHTFGLMTLVSRKRLGSSALRRAESVLPRFVEDLLGAQSDVAPLRTGAVVFKDGRVLGADTQGRAFFNTPEVRRVLEGDGSVAVVGRAAVRRTNLTSPDDTPLDDALVTVHPVRAPVVPAGTLLTGAQRSVAESLALGLQVAEIAEELQRKRSTVESHRKGVYDRLGCATRIELADRLLTL